MPMTAAQFAGLESAVLAGLGIDARPRTNKPCPACGGDDRFSLYPSGRHFCRQCGAGDFLDLIMKVHRCQFKDALTLAEGVVSGGRQCTPPPAIPPSKVDTRSQKIERVKSILAGANAIVPGDDVHRYLTVERGFPADILPVELLSHPGIEYWHESAPGKWESLGTFPAMVAPVRSHAGEVVAVHVTFLLDGRKAPVPSPKKLIGSPKGGAVRLYPAGEEVGIAEGIETAIAASVIFSKPVWAALSASLMPLVELPESIQLVHIFADNDSNKAGQTAAHKLIAKLKQEKRKVGACKTPTLQDADLYDVYKETQHEHNTRKLDC